MILDKAATIGGTWAENRLYPDIHTNNMTGTFEYSDFPMAGDAAFGVKPGEHIPGQAVHNYLKAYAEKFDIDRHCCFREEIISARKADNGAGWILTVQKPGENGNGPATHTVSTSKLIVASGLTSEAFTPDFLGAEAFEVPIIHGRNLLDLSGGLFASATSVVVLGGSKSGWDAAYSFASRGVHVDMVIRESGNGPAWMTPPYITPMKKWLEKVVTTRFITWFSPCAWGDADGFTYARWALHSTTIGRLISAGFWKLLTSDITSTMNYEAHPGTAKLKPWVDPYWTACTLSIINHPTPFFDLVKSGKITVHIRDITKLSRKTVHLSESPDTVVNKVVADALICCTGWKHHPALNFISADGRPLDAALGLPHHAEISDLDDPALQAADKEIFARFPVLQAQPKLRPRVQGNSASAARDFSLNRPFRLHRFMVPPAFIHDRTIGFSGMMQTINMATVAQAQALWLTAYFGGAIQPVSESKTLEEVERETELYSRFGKWRSPAGHGDRFPDFVFDTMPYLDMLLADLGLKGRRKEGIVKEIFEPYGPEDYVGLVDEWKKTLV